MIECTARTAEETQNIGEAIGRMLQPGDVILLSGQMGAGKTTLVQGLARGLGVSEPVTSPTFTLVHEYRTGRMPLLHLDPYRLESEGEIADLGFEDWLDGPYALVIEWAERLGSLSPAERLEITLIALPDESRSIRIQARGERWQARASQLEALTC